jgi:hypothetical protein
LTNLSTGAVIHTISFEGIVTELHDVAIVPGVRQPALLGPASQEMRRALKVDPETMAKFKPERS